MQHTPGVVRLYVMIVGGGVALCCVLAYCPSSGLHYFALGCDVLLSHLTVTLHGITGSYELGSQCNRDSVKGHLDSVEGDLDKKVSANEEMQFDKFRGCLSGEKI